MMHEGENGIKAPSLFDLIKQIESRVEQLEASLESGMRLPEFELDEGDEHLLIELEQQRNALADLQKKVTPRLKEDDADFDLEHLTEDELKTLLPKLESRILTLRTANPREAAELQARISKAEDILNRRLS